MKSIFKGIVLAMIVAVALSSLVFYYVIASEEISSQTILDTGTTVIGQDITYPSGSAQITSKIITIPVGVDTGPHIHEVPMFGYMMEGEITVDYGEKGLKTYLKGDSLVEAIKYVHNGKNTGDKPAKILVVLMSIDESKTEPVDPDN